MGLAVILLTGIFGLLFILYKRWSKIYDFWKERGVVHLKPYPFVGNMLDNMLRKKTMGHIYKDIALTFNQHKFIGIYNFVTADIMINDPETMHIVLVKEFSHFTDRGPDAKDARPLNRHLFLMNGAEWKGVRTKMSPAFSSGKLKGMFPQMLKSYDCTSKLIDSQLSTGEVKIKDVIDMFIVSTAASTIYGIDPSSLTDPNSQFKRYVDEASDLNFIRFLFLTVTVFFPSLAKKFNISPMTEKMEKFFINLVLNTFKDRVESGEVRDDIIQQLLQLKQTGKIEISQWVSEDTDELGNIETSTVTETIEITDEILVAHGFVFLMAGIDPLRSTLGMILIELCRHDDVLKRLREDINNCCKKHNGLTLQAVKDMEYLDWCISETFRLYPAAEFGARVCVKDYTFPEGFTVEKGTRILFPFLKFLKDPSYFPDPDTFKPERFQTPPPPWIFLPFGMGPRMCIARRYALMEMKVFIARIIQDYDISLDPRTELPVRTDKWFFLRRNVSPIHINFSRRNQN